MEVPDKHVKNVAINKNVIIIVRQMINASVSVQDICTKTRVEKITRFVDSVLVIVLQLFLCLIFCSSFVLLLFNFRVSETKKNGTILIKGGYRQKSKQSSLGGLFSFI